MTPLEERLIARITAGGPITVADYMTAALTDPDHGYYRRADPLGAAGDFVTAPEISQLFGEMIGAWLIDCWEQCGRPRPVRLVELGPGRGTLMADALRVGRLAPDFLTAIEVHLVEINPALRRAQAATVGRYRPTWHDALPTVPTGPILLVANEFLDALPIRQLLRLDHAWRERLVGWNVERGFHFVASRAASPLGLLVPRTIEGVRNGDLFEFSPAVIDTVAEISRRIAGDGGAALLIDYGRQKSAIGESLRAVRNHAPAPVLSSPGMCDISAHIDFALVRQVAAEGGSMPFGPRAQGPFLEALGIGTRAETLKRDRSRTEAIAIDAAMTRLIDPEAMGTLFKTLAISSGGLWPPGFDANDPGAVSPP